MEKEGRDVLDPLGVLSGLIFAAVTRASWGECVKCLNSANWSRVARILSGRAAAPLPEKVRAGPGLSNLGKIVNPDLYGLARGNLPAQTDGNSRLRAVN